MAFFMGLDLGQATDFTALSVIDFEKKAGMDRRYSFAIRHLQRFPLGTPYPEMVTRCIHIRERIRASALCIDATGVGRPVLDLFYAAGLTPVAITITGEGQAHNKAESESLAKKKQGIFYTPTIREALTWTVPKRDLVGAVTVAFQNKEILISSSLPDSKTLVDELLNFRMKMNPKTGHDSYEAWRDGVHDDLVLAVALPIWYARKSGLGSRIPISGAMGGQNLILPEIYAHPKDRWGNPGGFSSGDIPGLGG